MADIIKLIVGLGNPGKDYQATRHNVGFWLLEYLVPSASFTLEKKFSAKVAKTTIGRYPVWLLQPQTFMNRSGLAISQISRFYKIQVQQILVVHDDLDLPVGHAKLKKGGGHGGHNGLRDAMAQLNSRDFYRLRLGIGHPGDKNRVSDYVLSPPAKNEMILLQQAIENSIEVLDTMVAGGFDLAMNRLHSKN